ncbi:unnamed protein product, partial [marine sediment metagenome]
MIESKFSVNDNNCLSKTKEIVKKDLKPKSNPKKKSYKKLMSELTKS